MIQFCTKVNTMLSTTQGGLSTDVRTTGPRSGGLFKKSGALTRHCTADFIRLSSGPADFTQRHQASIS